MILEKLFISLSSRVQCVYLWEFVDVSQQYLVKNDFSMVNNSRCGSDSALVTSLPIRMHSFSIIYIYK